MQSGITASSELQKAFQSLLSDSSQRGLLATITNERIEPVTTLPSSSSFHSDLSKLEQHLDTKTPLYILLRRPDDLSSATLGSCVAVTYVPNSAHVRSKTLFASTRLQLVRDLGGEHFADSIFVTEATELSPQGWKAYEAHDDAAVPLTREEQEMENIKEAEALEKGGTGPRRMHVDSGFAVKVDGDVEGALEGLKEGELVQIKFDVPNETLVLDSSTSADPASLASTISATDPRYSFYRHPGGVLFIYTCPSKSKIKERMLYATSRQSVLNVASKLGIEVAKKIEATDPSDVTAEAVESEFKVEQAQQSNRTAFARPKRPGKK